MSTHSVKGTCKICKKDVVVRIDDEYLGSDEGVLKMATCNRCYDLRNDCENAEDNIANACRWLIQHPKISPEKLLAARKKLEGWTRDYAEAVAAMENSTKVIWSEEFAKNLMERPDKWHEQLKFYRQVFREQSALA